MKISITAFEQLKFYNQPLLFQKMMVGMPERKLHYTLLITEKGLKILSKERTAGAGEWVCATGLFDVDAIGMALEKLKGMEEPINQDPFHLFSNLAPERFYIDNIAVDKIQIKDSNNSLTYYKVHTDVDETMSIVKMQIALSDSAIWHPVGKLAAPDIAFLPSFIEDYESGLHQHFVRKNEQLVKLLNWIQVRRN